MKNLNLFFLLFLSLSLAAQKGSREQDSLALLAWFNQLEDKGELKWNPTQPLDQWQGLALDEQGRVVNLDLQNLQLKGSIPNLGPLAKLQRLDLSWNKLSGGIPNFDKLPVLKILKLSKNKFDQPFPSFEHCKELATKDF